MICFIKTIIVVAIYLIGNHISDSLYALATNPTYINQMKIDNSMEVILINQYASMRNVIPFVFIIFVIVLFIPEINKFINYLKNVEEM